MRLHFLRSTAAFAATLAALGAGAQNFLWEVTGLTNHAYLFGTLHAGKPEWYPLPKAVEDAFEASPVIVVEADITDTTAMEKSAAATTYTAPDTLALHVPPEQYKRFKALLPRYSVPEAAIAQMKPFMASSLLVFAEWARRGYLPNEGVDGYLIRKAKGEVKALEEIEGIDTQLRLLDSLTDTENRNIFEGTLTALESGLTDEQIQGMVQAWQVGDPAMMLEVARRYNDKVKGAVELEDKFIWSRHPEMLQKIIGYLDSRERHFIAVGALHLCGPRGLVEQLRSRGYVVRQVFVAPRQEFKPFSAPQPPGYKP